MIMFFFLLFFMSFLHVKWTENVRKKKIMELEKKNEVPSRANSKVKVKRTQHKRYSFAAYRFHVAKVLQKRRLKGKERK